MLGSLKKWEIEAAKGRVLKAARHLEDIGEVDLNNLRSSYHNELLV